MKNVLLFLTFFLLFSACSDKKEVVDQSYVRQAKVLIENHIWYFGPYSEFKNVNGRNVEFGVYLNSEKTSSIFVTKEKIMTPDGENGYVAAEFVVLPNQQGADLPTVKINKELIISGGFFKVGDLVLKIDGIMSPIYDKYETKNHDLLNILSILGIQLSNIQQFSGDFNIYVKDFYKDAVSSYVVIEKGDQQWIAQVRTDIDRYSNEITKVPLDSITEVNTDRLKYFTNQIKKAPLHNEVMRLPIKVSSEDDNYRP